MAANGACLVSVGEMCRTSPSVLLDRILMGLQEMTDVSREQDAAWRGALPHIYQTLQSLPPGLTVVFEYRLPMTSERIDLTLLGKSPAGKPTAVILELKGWRNAREVDNGIVLADGEHRQHPQWQVQNYLGKLKFCHSTADRFEFAGGVWLYNLPKGSLTFANECPAFHRGEHDALAEFLKACLSEALDDSHVQEFLEGRYIQTPHLFEAVRSNFEALRSGALQALCSHGFGPSEEQHQLLQEILAAVREGERTCFLVRGEPGSGKSYLAILLLLTALKDFGGTPQDWKRQNIAAFGCRNNRLLNTLRQVFDDGARGLGGVLHFFAPDGGPGLAKGDPHNPHFCLVVYDEAQRMPEANIPIAMQRGDVTVFFYDETQILTADEGGWTENFVREAKNLKRDVRQRELRGIYRVQGGRRYHDFVEQLLDSPGELRLPDDLPYDFRVFPDIRDMLGALREKGTQTGTKVALVAAFTESPGDNKRPADRSLANRRIGYPLQSGFARYRGLGVDIYWLMDPREQYPKFWLKGQSNDLTHCASIYGCQGFEADYVGVVWGRDFVWRNGRWTLGENCEDNIASPSLKQLFARAREGDEDARNWALRLLVNRYRVFLTRGIHGTYVYCEDDETGELLRRIFS